MVPNGTYVRKGPIRGEFRNITNTYRCTHSTENYLGTVFHIVTKKSPYRNVQLAISFLLR